MLAVLRSGIAAIFIIFMACFSLIYCAFSPKNPKHVYFFCRWFHQLHKLIGIHLIQRGLHNAENIPQAIYISNHQSILDFAVAPGMLRPNTVSLGKKSLLWLPFFGQLYWITGNILIDRENKTKARNTLQEVVKRLHQRQASLWIYPEGTRSQGRGLLPFKTGAFRLAIEAGIPIIPMCVSATDSAIDLNRRQNGTVITEMLAPIDTSNYTIKQARELAELCHTLMETRIQQLTEEAQKIDNERNVSPVQSA